MLWVKIEKENNDLQYFNNCFTTLTILCKHENVYKHKCYCQISAEQSKNILSIFALLEILAE